MSKTYQPPCTITPAMLSMVASIAETIGRLLAQQNTLLRLSKVNRIRTIHGSLAIEGNTLSEAQITAILQGKRVVAPATEIQEVRNAIKVYDRLGQWQALEQGELLQAHALLMEGLLDSAGAYRPGNVGVMGGEQVVHVAPPARRVSGLMTDLFYWLQQTDLHPLVASSIFHYEFEFIHPFEDGNGRMGRLWQSVLLYRWNPLFQDLPVESMIFARQQDYYQALNQSTQSADAAPFLEFMLQVIQSTLEASQSSPQVTLQVTPQVEALLTVLKGDMSRTELMAVLGLSDRKSFSQRYLLPALQAGLIEMTIPDKPNSRLQKYRLKKDEHLGIKT